MPGRWKLNQPALSCVLLALAVATIYLPAVFLGFTNYDDPYYVTENPHVRNGLSLDGVRWALSHTCAGNWQPLTLISHQLDCQLFGLKPGGHHVTSVLFHAANAILLFVLLHALTGARWRSAAVAALFALHPLRVESVAWIAERKDVLSTFFGLLSLWAYTKHAKGQASESRKRSFYYCVALLLLLFGLMSKPMLVTWPFVMLLLDYWPLGRFGAGSGNSSGIRRALIIEKIPFLALSAASCVVTYLAQTAATAVAPLQDIPIGGRVVNAIISYARYLWKLVWPTRLAAIYPYVARWPAGEVVAAALLLALITALALWQYKRRPFLIFGWAWYLGTLVPVIGIVQIGNQSIADRYTYIPAIGMLVSMVWAVAEWGEIEGGRHGIVNVAAGCGMAACALLTRRQLAYWQNTETLFRHAIAVTGNNHIAWRSLGFHFADRHEPKEAESCFRTALAISPGDFYSWNKLATVLIDEGRYDEAIALSQKALQLNPRMAAAHSTFALALMKLGKTKEAIERYEESLRLDPEQASAHYNLANAYAREGQFAKAREHYQESVRLDPSSAEAHNNLGYMLVREGKLTEAAFEFRAAVALEPGSWHAHYGLGDALARQGKLKEAANEFLEVLRIEPKSASAQAQINRIAWILASAPDPQVRDGAKALELAQRVCGLTSYTNAVVIETLAVAQAENGRFAEAVNSAEQARSVAAAAGQSEAAQKAEKLLELFRAGRPYRESTAPRQR